MLRGRRLLLSIAIVIVAAVAGAFIGALVVDQRDQVADAADALVPPDGVVEERIEGRPGVNFGPLFDYRGPYRVTIRGMEADDPYDDRLARNHVRAVGEGWEEQAREELPNATAIVYERNGLELQLSIRASSPVWRIRVEEDTGAERRAMLLGGGLGAAVAACALVVVARRRGPSPPDPAAAATFG